jgi:hypothetical protein
LFCAADGALIARMKAPLLFVVSSLFVGSVVACSSGAPAKRSSTGGESGSDSAGSGDAGSGGGGSGGSGASGSGGGGSGGSAGSSTGGAGGVSGAGGTGGDSGSGGAGGTSGAGGSSGSGGADASGLETGGAGGSTGGAGGSDAGAAGTGMAGGEVSGWYEAEAIPPNVLTGSTLVVNPPKPRVGHCPACPAGVPKPGDSCCSGGGEVTWLTQGIGPLPGGLTYNKVMAPTDGMYDVTWWYHCGNNDNFGDVHCGGQKDPPTTAAGCRPHQIVVNGTELTGTYHFPCFGGSFTVIHAATTPLMLKAGENSIKVYPKQRDAADMDALQVQPPGKGIGPIIMSNSSPGAN